MKRSETLRGCLCRCRTMEQDGQVTINKFMMQKLACRPCRNVLWDVATTESFQMFAMLRVQEHDYLWCWPVPVSDRCVPRGAFNACTCPSISCARLCRASGLPAGWSQPAMRCRTCPTMTRCEAASPLHAKHDRLCYIPKLKREVIQCDNHSPCFFSSKVPGS